MLVQTLPILYFQILYNFLDFFKYILEDQINLSASSRIENSLILDVFCCYSNYDNFKLMEIDDEVILKGYKLLCEAVDLDNEHCYEDALYVYKMGIEHLRCPMHPLSPEMEEKVEEDIYKFSKRAKLIQIVTFIQQIHNMQESSSKSVFYGNNLFYLQWLCTLVIPPPLAV